MVETEDSKEMQDHRELLDIKDLLEVQDQEEIKDPVVEVDILDQEDIKDLLELLDMGHKVLQDLLVIVEQDLPVQVLMDLSWMITEHTLLYQTDLYNNQ